tara:strand:+ start:73 stop:456 length:384 start_codon:yes stop_codon:yes gene_type:complete
MEIDKKKPKSARPIVGIIPKDSKLGSTLLNKGVAPTSITRGVFAVADRLSKIDPKLEAEFLEKVQWYEDNSTRVGRKASFTSDETKEKAKNMLETIRNMSRNDLSAFKSLVNNDDDFKTCTITRVNK